MKLNIELFGGRRASSSSVKFLDIDANTPQEFIQKRRDYINKNIRFENVSKGNYNTLRAMVDGKIAGDIRYETIDGQSNIINVNVSDDYRRSGVATHLYKELQAKTPNKALIVNDFTDEGEALAKNIGVVRKNKNGKYSVKVRLK